jgi:putative endopeptidase
VGQAYVRVAFPPESKERANRLITGLRQALAGTISKIDWMAEPTKKQALVKLEATLQKIGYPDRWRDYGALKVTPGDYLANREAANAFEFRRQLKKIGEPVDRNEWSMTPPTINAWEDPQMNTISFPAGILQPPFFAGDQDDASNYGAIGVVAGHEIIHGFDDQGRKFDEKGNLRDWWSPEDAKRYEERGKCISDQYTQEIPELGVKQNGLLTQGEDTADNGGIRLAMRALEETYRKQGRSLDEPGPGGITPRQRFFLSFAFSWCGAERPEFARMLVTTDPHSLRRFRVNRSLSNMAEFAQAFGCKSGQPMVHEPRCQVW